MSEEKRVRLHAHQRRLIVEALLEKARKEPWSTWECWLIARSLAGDVRGKRPRWQGRKVDRQTLGDMEKWSGKGSAVRPRRASSVSRAGRRRRG